MTQIYWTDIESPIGNLRVASSEKGLVYIELPRANGRGFRGWMKSYAADEKAENADAPNQAAVDQILEYIEGKRREFDLPIDLRATAFQRSVYAELSKVPYGEQRSYAEIAAAVGRPRAVRAVGSANGANPLPFVIPCHRVIASGGQLSGYAGGVKLKARLLAMESATPGPGRLF